MMTKEELRRLTGSMQQVAGIRDVCFTSGRARGLGAYEIKNGPLFLRILKDRCLDIEELSYKGTGFNFLAKTGLLSPGAADVSPGAGAQRSIMGGFLFTAGLDNICAPCTVDRRDYLMHGRIRSAPAELLSSNARWEDGTYHLSVSGEAREAELFGENLVLRRQIETVYGDRSFILTDEIENQALRPEPYLLLYHINFGYPLLNAGTELLLPALHTEGRDETAKAHQDGWAVMPPPQDEAPENVFLHQLAADEDGLTAACVVNQELELGLELEFSVQALPYFMQWQSPASGDYALGLEPATASVFGRAYHAERGDLPQLAPFETVRKKLRFTILEGTKEIEAARQRIQSLLARH